MCGCVPKRSGISTSCVRVSKYIQNTHTHTHTYQYTHTRTRKVCSGLAVDLCALTVTFSHTLSLTHIYISYMYLYTQHKCAVVTIWYKTTSEGQHLLKQSWFGRKKNSLRPHISRFQDWNWVWCSSCCQPVYSHAGGEPVLRRFHSTLAIQDRKSGIGILFLFLLVVCRSCSMPVYVCVYASARYDARIDARCERRRSRSDHGKDPKKVLFRFIANQSPYISRRLLLIS
jgi:hypothetical protein